MPIISIIVPVYNASKYLKECLDSIIKQEFKDWECILINDCSKDNSLEILRQYEARDSRFIVIDNEKNLGVSGARYKGLSLAKGEWIAFVDNDDVVNSRYLQCMYDAAKKNPEVNVVCCLKFDFLDGNEICWPESDEAVKIISESEAIAILFSDNRYNMNSIWCKLIRKSTLINFDYERYIKDFPICYFEDGFVIPLLFMRSDSLVLLSNKLYAYRFLQTSFSHSTTSGRYAINQVHSAQVIYDKLKGYSIDAQKKCYEGIMLGIIKAYYCSRKEKEVRYEAAKLFAEFYPERKKYSNINKYTMINITLFKFSHFLWCITIGWLYWGAIAKFPTLYQKVGNFR